MAATPKVFVDHGSASGPVPRLERGNGSGGHRYVLDGKIVLIDDQGNREECVAGEGVVLPPGLDRHLLRS